MKRKLYFLYYYNKKEKRKTSIKKTKMWTILLSERMDRILLARKRRKRYTEKKAYKGGDHLKQKSFTCLISGLLAGIVLLTFALTAITSNHFIRKNLTENAVENGQRNVRADDVSLSAYLSSLSQSVKEIYYNTGIYPLLYQPSPSYEDNNAIFTWMQSLVNLSEKREVLQIYMNLENSGRSYLVGRDGRSTGIGNYSVEIPDAQGPYQAFCEISHPSHSYGMAVPGSEEVNVCTFHWNIYSAMGRKIIGTISVDVLTEKLADYLASAGQGTPVYLLTDAGDIIYQNTDMLSEAARMELLEEHQEKSWSRIQEASFHGVAFVQSISSSLVDWKIIELKTEDELFGTADRILLWQILMLAGAGAICVSSLFLVVIHLTKPLRELKNYASSVEKGNLTVNIRDYTSYHRMDEIGILIVHMENMMKTIREMFVRQKKLGQAQRNIEMKMLLAQINPHFIYNTLQSISTQALIHGDKDTYQLLVRLGAEMQYSMNLEKEVVHLKEEMQYVENYLVLQQQRFENRFHFEIWINPEDESITVPKMSLQPLVENAIKHGKIHQTPGGFIKIQTARSDKHLEILLADNGLGCPENRRKELNEALEHLKEDDVYVKEHIGMKNVGYRLRLLYGDKVSMRIETSVWNGAQVTIRIPLDQYEGGPVF